MTRFSSRPAHALAAFATLAFTACMGAAHAQGPSASALQQLCPGAADQLADSLDRVAREHREVSNVFVTLSVKDQRIAGVELFGAESTYQRAVKQAVRGLRCTGAEVGQSAQAQFVVQFAVPPALAAAPAMPMAKLSSSLPGSATASLGR